jgi:outer membrane biosynthesis protein TonB
METLVFFVAIAAIQLFASYVKRNKDKAEAAKKAQQRASQPAHSAPAERPVPPSHRPAPPPESAPMPDPLKEIMRQLGMPEARPQQAAPPPEPVREAEAVLERPRADMVEERPVRHFEEQKAHKPVPKVPKAHKAAAVAPTAAEAAVNTGDLGLSIEETARFEAAARARSGAQNLPGAADLKKGLIWAAILQEPRFRRPWNPAIPVNQK